MILLSPCHPSATASLRADQRTLTQPCSSQALHRGGWASCAHALRRSPAPSRTPPASLRCPAESPLPAAPRRAAGRTGTARHGPISNGIRQGSTYLRAVLRLINNNDKSLPHVRDTTAPGRKCRHPCPLWRRRHRESAQQPGSPTR